MLLKNAPLSEIRSNASRVYSAIRGRIVRCELAPNQKLKIAELAAELSVSPGAVREALSRLSTEHLVIAIDQRGFRTAPISLSDLNEITEARIEVESSALSLAMQRAGDREKGLVRDAEDAMLSFGGARNSDEAAALHDTFHSALVTPCANSVLLRTRAALYEMTQRYRYLAQRNGAIHRDVEDEHRRVAAAFIAGDVAAARAEMAAHIRCTADIVRDLIVAGEAQDQYALRA